MIFFLVKTNVPLDRVLFMIFATHLCFHVSSPYISACSDAAIIKITSDECQVNSCDDINVLQHENSVVMRGIETTLISGP